MRLIIVSDYPFSIEKSGYANQCDLLLRKIIDTFPDIEIIFVPLSITTTTANSYYKLITYDIFKDLLNLDLNQKYYIEKIKVFLIKHRSKLFEGLSILDNQIKLTKYDKMFFYCDFGAKLENNIKAIKYYWYPCHFSFNFEIILTDVILNLKK